MKIQDKGIAALKKMLWTEFALFIKLTHSEDGHWCRCYTCDNAIEIGTTGCQGGHWKEKGAYLVHYFNEDNVRPQCTYCNLSLQGNVVEFERRLRLEIGDARVDDILETRSATVKRPKYWYIDKIFHYREENKRMKAAA